MGEKAADDAGRWLDAVARSKELRLDTELYVLKHGQAEELIAGDDAPEDVFADLSSLAKLVREDGPSPVPTCADVSRALLSSGSSLATAIELTEGADGKLTPVPSGYAILTGSGLAGWLSGEEALGAGLFMGGPGISVVELEDGITAELAGADVALDARWGKDGGIEGIDVSAEVKGSVIEAPAGQQPRLRGGLGGAGAGACRMRVWLGIRRSGEKPNAQRGFSESGAQNRVGSPSEIR